MDIFFSTSEQKCQLCFRWIVHEVIGSISELCNENHCTCICGLLNYGTVCCLRGYMTLLQEENDLLYIADVDPKGSNFHRILYSQKQEIPSQSEMEARAHLIGYLNDSGIKLLSEVVFNVLFNNLSLSKREKSRMRKMYQSKEKTFKIIGKKRNSIKRRRRLLRQHGSNLGPLLSIAANSLSGRLFGHN